MYKSDSGRGVYTRFNSMALIGRFHIALSLNCKFIQASWIPFLSYICFTVPDKYELSADTLWNIGCVNKSSNSSEERETGRGDITGANPPKKKGVVKYTCQVCLNGAQGSVRSPSLLYHSNVAMIALCFVTGVHSSSIAYAISPSLYTLCLFK